jgi:predicted transcriptional regulator
MRAATKADKKQRATEVRAMLDEGASLNDIAKHFDLTQQAVAKFLKVRGWRTAEALRRDGVTTPEVAEKERIKAERKARRQGMKEVVDRG